MKNKLSQYRRDAVAITIGLTALVFLTTYIYLNAYLKSDQAATIIARGDNLFMSSQVLVAMIVVGLSIVAVFAVYIKNKFRGQFVENLNDDFCVVFEQIEDYVGLSQLNRFEKIDLKGDVLMLFLEAQENGKTPEQVIGDDVFTFVEDMVLAYGVRNNFMNDLLTGLQFFVAYLVFVFLLLFFKGQNTFFNIEIDYLLLLFFTIASFIIIPITFSGKRKSIRSKHKRSNLPYLISVFSAIVIAVVFIASVEFLRSRFINIAWVKILMDDGVVVFRSPIHLVMVLSIIPIVHVVKKTIRRPL